MSKVRFYYKNKTLTLNHQGPTPTTSAHTHPLASGDGAHGYPLGHCSWCPKPQAWQTLLPPLLQPPQPWCGCANLCELGVKQNLGVWIQLPQGMWLLRDSVFLEIKLKAIFLPMGKLWRVNEIWPISTWYTTGKYSNLPTLPWVHLRHQSSRS